MTKLADKIKDMANASAQELVEKTLKEDYKLDGKKVTLDTSNSFEFKAQDPSHYVLTITFTVA